MQWNGLISVDPVERTFSVCALGFRSNGDPNDPIHLKAFDKAGCLGAYPRRRVVSELVIPEELDFYV